ncbi:MAG: energy-coupling factor transporter transmembrane protein EcfT [Treponema sp.]|jgi:energy-coupling factor transport system permease protein|nr:energy-coupling factor transporter transmembrane protein EcfT [Treponema sp.]
MKKSIDPRTKLIVLIFINISVFTMSAIYIEWLNMALIVVLCLLFGQYKNCLKYSAAYIAAMVLINITAGYENHVLAALSIIVFLIRRFLPMLMFGSFLISTTRVSELITALQKMGLPKGAVITFAAALRFIPTVREELSQVRDAMKLRGKGFTVKNILTRPLATVENTLIPLMLRSATIAEELAAAAVTRGIDASQRRTSFYTLRFGLLDVLCALLFGSLAAGSLYVKRGIVF